MAKKILVIDDDPLVCKSLYFLLNREGYLVDIMKNSKEVLEKIKNQDFDLIICDIRMPEIDGIELIRQIKKYRKDSERVNIPVIFITGYASKEAPVKARDLGAESYLLKPFDIDMLLDTVKKILF